MNKYACTFFFNKSEDNIVCVCTPGYTLFVPGIFFNFQFSIINHCSRMFMLKCWDIWILFAVYLTIYYYYIPISLALCKDWRAHMYVVYDRIVYPRVSCLLGCVCVLEVFGYFYMQSVKNTNTLFYLHLNGILLHS